MQEGPFVASFNKKTVYCVPFLPFPLAPLARHYSNSDGFGKVAPFHWLTQLHTGNPLALEAFELQHGSFKQQQTGEKRKGKEEEKEKESNTTAAKHNSREQQSNSSGAKERKRLGPEREV